MGGRFPKVVLPIVGTVVTEKSGVDEQGIATEKYRDRETIGMAVQGVRDIIVPRTAALFAAIETDVIGSSRPVAAQDEVTAVAECARGLAGNFAGHALEL